MLADHDLRERLAAAELARVDLYFFARWMFLQRRGFHWQRAAHHRAICDALMRVFRGKCTRLVINIPPRYSKTELAVVNFIAWALGQHPDAEFIHASYSATLAANNSAAVRAMLKRGKDGQRGGQHHLPSVDQGHQAARQHLHDQRQHQRLDLQHY